MWWCGVPADLPIGAVFTWQQVPAAAAHLGLSVHALVRGPPPTHSKASVGGTAALIYHDEEKKVYWPKNAVA